MLEDPILFTLTAICLIAIPIISKKLGKYKPKHYFTLPLITMAIAFPLFLFLMIVPDTPNSIYFFYASMSLWTGGFIGFFFSIYFYSKGRKK
ncbi:MAG: hypothetical protein K9L02_04280 [Acholeplasmataceae bacterium]|nr:hypothetical protein [Acholeplasmataceae bacterium]